MRIATNTSSLFVQRKLNTASSVQQTSMERLASGLRINSAKDDAAGMQISNKLTTQVNGNTVAIRNANDAISMAQVGEGALQEVTNSLHRMRDLAIQASNATYSKSDRKAINEEFTALKLEIDRIAEDTTFGDRQVFTSAGGSMIDLEEREIIRGLQASWLKESEDIIFEHFGLKGKGEIKIDLERLDPAGPNGTALAYVESAFTAASTEAAVQVMVINTNFFNSMEEIHGGSTGPLKETILHEWVHAVQAKNFEEFQTLPAWFKEGSAEVLRGADASLSLNIANAGGGTAGIDVVAGNLFAELGSTTVVSQAGAYGGGYVALRYIDHQLGKDGIKDLMSELADGATLNAALNTASNAKWTSEADLLNELNAASTNPDYAGFTRFTEFVSEDMDLGNVDNGALGGRDADRGEIREETISQTGTGSRGGSDGFREILVLNDADSTVADFSAGTAYNSTTREDIRIEDYDTDINGAGGQSITFQVGANSNDVLSMTFGALSSTNLGLEKAELVEEPQFAIFAVDDALKMVDSQRALYGATMNRLESSVSYLTNNVEQSSASRARIRDTDFANTTAEMTKAQILTQAGSTLLAQANQFPQAALSLLP